MFNVSMDGFQAHLIKRAETSYNFYFYDDAKRYNKQIDKQWYRSSMPLLVI